VLELPVVVVADSVVDEEHLVEEPVEASEVEEEDLEVDSVEDEVEEEDLEVVNIKKQVPPRTIFHRKSAALDFLSET